MKSTRSLISALVLASAPFATQSMIVKSTDILRIEFRLPARPINELAQVDTVFLTINSASTFQNVDASATLFNGSNLLGTASKSFAAGTTIFDFYWSGIGSSLTNTEAVRIDASSLIDRSINGRIDIRLSSHSELEQPDLNAGFGFGNALRVDGGNNAYLTQVSVIPASVPEPVSLAFMLFGLAALFATGTIKILPGQRYLNVA